MLIKNIYTLWGRKRLLLKSIYPLQGYKKIFAKVEQWYSRIIYIEFNT